MKTMDIQIRDPFILPVEEEKRYYLFGTTDSSCWSGPATGFNCFRSADLVEWEGPIPAFRPPAGFWGTRNFWAPEVHVHAGRYYMFATFKSEQRYRGTQVLVSEAPAGPYVPLTEGPVTPPDYECLDGTLHVDEAGDPWIVFCQEWEQVCNGAMHAMRLTPDLTAAAGRPVLLFNASEAPWVNRPGWPAPGGKSKFPIFVTDGPFLHRTSGGVLLMLWSSVGRQGYAMGLARSATGTVTGHWEQLPDPLWAEDGGHGMVFRTFDGRLWMTFHQPNRTPDERPVFVEIEEAGDLIRRKSSNGKESQ